MKKFIASTLVVLLLAQSLTPATYASTDVKSDYGYGATTTETPAAKAARNTSKTTSFIDTYKNSDLGKLNPLEVTQVAIV